jgi:polyhydroxyalkanoate synthesis regulator phasin
MSDLRSLVQESWSKAVLAASSVEEQAQELVGKITQTFQEGPLSTESAQKLFAEIAGRLREQRQQIQSQVEDAVRRGLDRLSPARAELRELSERIDQLEQRVAGLNPNGESHA